MESYKKDFRPSKLSRFLYCNLWRVLKETDYVSPKAIERMEAGTAVHARLAEGEFLPAEAPTKEVIDSITQKCGELHKEITLAVEVKEGVSLEGTPDVWGYDSNTKTLYIVDYKTGMQFVGAQDNIQLQAYAFLVLKNADFPVDMVHAYILNTRYPYPASIARYPAEYLTKNFAEKLEYAITMNQTNSIFARVGEHCRYCPSKPKCPLYRSFRGE